MFAGKVYAQWVGGLVMMQCSNNDLLCFFWHYINVKGVWIALQIVFQCYKLAGMLGCMSLVNVKAVLECEWPLLCWRIINEALLHTGEWAHALCNWNLCMSPRVQVGDHSLIIALGNKGILPVWMLYVVYSLTESWTWQTGLLRENFCFANVVNHLTAFLQYP